MIFEGSMTKGGITLKDRFETSEPTAPDEGADGDSEGGDEDAAS